MVKDIGNAKHFEEEDLRFATPVNVAKYRADRLKCKKIVDLCSGIGIQAGAFAKTCGSVLAIEIDKRKVDYSEKNFGNVSNLKFVCGDVMDEKIIDEVRKFKPDIIFCDPERLPSEKERNLDSIKPDLKKLIKVYSEICKNICIEIPPRIELSKLNELGIFEAEYLSMDNKLNRLDIYFGDLKKDDRSVADVFGTRLVDNKNKKAKHTNRVNNYIYELSEAVIKAGLINELACLVCADILEGCEKNRVLLTSKEPQLELECLAKPYIVIGIVERFDEVNSFLKRNRFGKVVIKYSILPEDYWKERNKLENGLRGNREGVVFKIDGKYVVCEEYD